MFYYRKLNSNLSEICYKASQIQNPYEAMFFLTAGISYLQPFEDGNKRMGRLLGNLPLLRAGLPPISFIGVDKQDYIQGLIEFYELRETETLGKALSEGYLTTSNAYSNAAKSNIKPKSVELRYHHEINNIMKDIIDNALVGYDNITLTVNKYTRLLTMVRVKNFTKSLMNIFLH